MDNTRDYIVDGKTLYVSDSTITGCDNTIVGHKNTMIGNGNTIIGNFNKALGNTNNVWGNNTVTKGNGNSVKGHLVDVKGNGNVVKGDDPTVKGNGNNITGKNAVVKGNGNTITGDCSNVVGNGNRMTDQNSVVVGNWNFTLDRIINTDTVIPSPHPEIDLPHSIISSFGPSIVESHTYSDKTTDPRKQISKKIRDMIIRSPDSPGEDECNICFDNKRRVVFIPCDHFWTCLKCSLSIIESGKAVCHMCKSDIQNVSIPFM